MRLASELLLVQLKGLLAGVGAVDACPGVGAASPKKRGSFTEAEGKLDEEASEAEEDG